ncbi:MAG: hypothetical protein JSU61_10860 [Fidelibacterota bacterium]|nr:MAG: hypothetical protein JSU61_10860 [Candidatus Neomarinimicrobiota bacterium]
MIRMITITLTAMLLLAGCATRMASSGIDLENFDTTYRPQDDFFRYVNGAWLAKTEIPADRSNYGSFTVLLEESQENLRAIIEESAAQESKVPGSNQQKVGDFYLSFMDSARIEESGLTPLEGELGKITAIQDRDDLLAYLTHAMQAGVQTPVRFYVGQDAKASENYIVYATQSGLGLPDRDYYFKEDEKFSDIRSKYVAYMEEILALAGEDDAALKAARIMEMETAMAEHHWTRVENRDRDKTYNKYDLAGLAELTPGFSWSGFLAEAELSDKVEAIIVRQPSFVEAFDKIYNEVSIEDWKAYFTFKLLNAYGPYLPAEFVEARFDFYGKTVRGIEENQPRWKRGVTTIDNILGEAVGQIYVERHFKPEAKARMEELVENLKLAFKERVMGLEWMGEATKEQALVKLGKFGTKIGYPDKWRDYSKLEITSDELLDNMIRANRHEYERQTGKLGQPVDRDEWFMTPQTVNAYYSSTRNEIVFPAAILQPPFFNVEADDAVNYGAIGAVIGHEITHGFDDQGRKSDGDGNLRNWWTEEDEKEFKQRAQVIIDQYKGYVPIDTMRINGELTLGENIGDLGGVTIAYNAYRWSLGGQEAPVIDGLTGDQRFFIGWAQIWRRLYRDDELRRRIVTDPHSPAEYRVIGVMANMPEFYEAFDVQEGDALYRASEDRVVIW